MIANHPFISPLLQSRSFWGSHPTIHQGSVLYVSVEHIRTASYYLLIIDVCIFMQVARDEIHTYTHANFAPLYGYDRPGPRQHVSDRHLVVNNGHSCVRRVGVLTEIEPFRSGRMSEIKSDNKTCWEEQNQHISALWTKLEMQSNLVCHHILFISFRPAAVQLHHTVRRVQSFAFFSFPQNRNILEKRSIIIDGLVISTMNISSLGTDTRWWLTARPN